MGSFVVGVRALVCNFVYAIHECFAQPCSVRSHLDLRYPARPQTVFELSFRRPGH